MKIPDIIKLIIFLIFFGGFFYLLTDSLIEEHKKRKTYHRIEFSGGRIYWADSVHVVSQREVSFVDVYSKRNVRIYGHFTISSPKK